MIRHRFAIRSLERVVLLFCAFLSLLSSGCTAIFFPIKAIPASKLSDEFRPASRNDLIPIDYRLLGQAQPDIYRLDTGDILAVFIEGILPFSGPDTPGSVPPVNFPQGLSSLPPSLGFPIPVQENGTISLPSIDPIMVRGLSVDEVRIKIAESYAAKGVLEKASIQPLVSLMREREYRVSVIRQDFDKSASGGRIKLPAYKNDVLNALLETGGLPGLSSKDEIVILRQSALNGPMIEEEVPALPVLASHSLPIATGSCSPTNLIFNGNSYTLIPLRLPIGMNLELNPGDTILNEGDLIFIQSRDSEVFYTAGILPGGQHVLPRDHDIDVFEALSIAGYSYGHSGRSGGGGGMGGMAGMTGMIPSRLYVLRKTPDRRQINIKVDLVKAFKDPRERLIIQPGDTLLLRYSPAEEVANFGIFAIFTFGIRQLFQN